MKEEKEIGIIETIKAMHNPYKAEEWLEVWMKQHPGAPKKTITRCQNIIGEKFENWHHTPPQSENRKKTKYVVKRGKNAQHRRNLAGN